MAEFDATQTQKLKEIISLLEEVPNEWKFYKIQKRYINRAKQEIDFSKVEPIILNRFVAQVKQIDQDEAERIAKKGKIEMAIVGSALALGAGLSGAGKPNKGARVPDKANELIAGLNPQFVTSSFDQEPGGFSIDILKVAPWLFAIVAAIIFVPFIKENWK